MSFYRKKITYRELKNPIFITIILCLLFSSCNEHETKTSNTEEIIQIEVTDSISNFESLLSTNHLYYLRHMSPDYNNMGEEFWESIDTLNNNRWIMIR